MARTAPFSVLARTRMAPAELSSRYASDSGSSVRPSMTTESETSPSVAGAAPTASRSSATATSYLGPDGTLIEANPGGGTGAATAGTAAGCTPGTSEGSVRMPSSSPTTTASP